MPKICQLFFLKLAPSNNHIRRGKRWEEGKPPSQGNSCQTQSYHPFSFRQSSSGSHVPSFGGCTRIGLSQLWLSISLYLSLVCGNGLIPENFKPTHTPPQDIGDVGRHWGYDNWEGAPGLQWVEVRDAPQPPAMPRQLPITENYLVPGVNKRGCDTVV